MVLGTTVIKVEPDLLPTLREQLMRESGVVARRTTNPYEFFRVSCGAGVIVAYTSGKIVISNDSTADVVRRVLSMVSRRDKHGLTVGSDEAGKGEWLGPMVVGAVALTPDQAQSLRGWGIMDSKELRPEKIRGLAQRVRTGSLAHETVLISPKTFEQRLRELRSEGKNLNDLLAWAHAKAIGLVIEEVPNDLRKDLTIVVDQFAYAKTRERVSRVVDLSLVRLIQRPHAEDNIAVAAASILARDARDEWIALKSRELGIDLTSLSAQEVSTLSFVDEIAKVSYIRKLL